jgi:hypothetical protein
MRYRSAIPRSLRLAPAIAIVCAAGIGQVDAGPRRPTTMDVDPEELTVYAFSQSEANQEDPQIYRLKPDVNIRAFQKWSTSGDEASDYNFAQIGRYHDRGIAFIGGGTASVIFGDEFGSAALFDDLSTRDANNIPVPHDYIVPGARRGSMANPKFRKQIVDYCKLQIDGGVDGLFLDEVNGGFGGGLVHSFNGNEGFDDYALADFNRYLLEKYPDFRTEDWKASFGMTDDNVVRRDAPPSDLVNNFNYRTYLQAHGWNGGTGAADSPLNALNPLASEWGSVVGNRMYADDHSFTATYLRRYWSEIVTELREYARTSAHRHILITSNGLIPYVDFNSVGMYPFNRDEVTPDFRGADYVPVVDGHLNGSKSLAANYRYLKDLGSRISGDVPLVVFIDWPTDMMANYLNLPLSEKKDYWQIFGAEAYANGMYPAFHLRDTVGSPTADDQGMLSFFEEYTRFYKQNRRLYQRNADSPNAVSVGAHNVAASLLSQHGGRVQVLHLVNHNYNHGITPLGQFSVEIELAVRPKRITMVSPDFAGKRTPAHTFRNGKLTVRVDGLRYYDAVVIE